MPDETNVVRDDTSPGPMICSKSEVDQSIDWIVADSVKDNDALVDRMFNLSRS